MRFVIIVVLAAAGMTSANVGRPNTGGQTASEPIGIRDVAIEHEILRIDLRPLADGGAVRVEATYRLYNSGREQRLQLLFAAASSAEDFRISLDGEELAATPVSKRNMPEFWEFPSSTPPIPGRGENASLRYQPRSTATLGFVAVIPPGRHTLSASYSGEAGVHLFGHPTVFRQFGYSLAPARSWAGFGGLDVTVHVPAGWHAATTPDLVRDADTLRGQFTDIPADHLAITVQAPEGSTYRPTVYGSIALLIALVLGGLIASWRLGRHLGRRESQPTATPRGFWVRHAFPWTMLWGLAWAVCVFGGGLLAIFAPDACLPSGQASHYGYGQAFVVIGVAMLSLVLLPIGFAIAQITAVVAAGASQRQQWTPSVNEPA